MLTIGFGVSTSVWVCEETAYPGVRRVCDMVRRDIELVTDILPPITASLLKADEAVLVGTVGKSAMIDGLEMSGKLDLSCVRGKREVYTFQLVEEPLEGIKRAVVIAGSDKRGTIYGLFHLSELLGVSPLVDWAEVIPQKRGEVILDSSMNKVSREPSVKYRGIFLNDEWPALGTWATTRFGGFNAAMYAHVFELILRLKGNYLWPAMWHCSFNLDGPGLESAILADELGIVMGASHHEPCMRAGEEYALVRGTDSIYGDAWNFRSNREGIVNFWKDGLKRNRAFENIITVGMRGEQDTAIMGNGATLKDNVDLLRDVIREQNRLIQENVCQDLDKVQRLFVLFTEVEAFFYGNEETKGLMGDPVLNGVTLMLSDDNFGNLRSLPTKEMREHPGGCGLYYHLDFHGGAYAYDWMNTDYLPKMWEQLTCAYEGGIQEVWVANIGDLCLLEYPLCYFMDLAYDMESHGVNAINATPKWTAHWVQKQFASAFSQADRQAIQALLDDYTLINHNRKPEVMNIGVYHPVHFGETKRLLALTEKIKKEARSLLDRCPESLLPAFWELIYYPAVASVNHCEMWLCATLNDFYAHQGRMEANDWADRVQRCILRDRALTNAYHAIGNGRFYGMALSEHIGFVDWCEDGNRYPIMLRVEGANKTRLLVADALSDRFTIGSRWSGNTLTLEYALNQGVDAVEVDLTCGSREPVCYTVETDCPWLIPSHYEGCVSRKNVLIIQIDRTKFTGRVEGIVAIKANKTSYIHIWAENRNLEGMEKGLFLESEGIICMEASHFAAKHDTADGAFCLLEPYGRTGSAVKVLPPVLDYRTLKDRPWVEYRFEAAKDGDYILDVYMAPSNTATMDHQLCFGLQINNEGIMEINGVGENFRSLNLKCMEWDRAVRDNIRIKTLAIQCRKGVNSLRIYGGSPLVVLERLVLHQKEHQLPISYLGPTESYCV